MRPAAFFLGLVFYAFYAAELSEEPIGCKAGKIRPLHTFESSYLAAEGLDLKSAVRRKEESRVSRAGTAIAAVLFSGHVTSGTLS